MGTNTDPYQWVEGRYKLMSRHLGGAARCAQPVLGLTKSPLLLRDIALLMEMAQRTQFTACLSIPTLDEKAWRATEPHTPNPRARLEAVAELNRAGVPTSVLIAPLMPESTDDPAQVAKILEMASDAGAAYVSGICTTFERGGARICSMEWLARAASRPVAALS